MTGIYKESIHDLKLHNLTNCWLELDLNLKKPQLPLYNSSSLPG